MEMTDNDSLNSRLKGIADEIKTDDMSIIKKRTNIFSNDFLTPNEYSKKIGTPFKQQRLPAWQPILTAQVVIPWLLVIGIIFIPVGILFLTTSDSIQEIENDYTFCKNENQQTCADLISNVTKFSKKSSNCICKIEFNLKEPIDKNVFFYYALTNFYQNHRRYVKSRDDKQLLGHLDSNTLPSCSPFDRAYDSIKKQNMLIAPCGAIANSLFNDTFKLYLETNEVRMLENEISWPTDRKYKFKNPANLSELERYTHPVNWNKYLQDFSTANSTAFENEHLIVWMRSATLPKFRKLYARIDHTMDQFKYGLPKGNYKVEIEYNYPVTQFNGKKSFILSNTSWLGGKNSFLGFAYIITGSLCILMNVVLFFIYKKYGVRERDMIKVDTNTPFVYSNLDTNN